MLPTFSNEIHISFMYIFKCFANGQVQLTWADDDVSIYVCREQIIHFLHSTNRK